MSTIQVLDKTFVPYLTEVAIQSKITELAAQLNGMELLKTIPENALRLPAPATPHENLQPESILLDGGIFSRARGQLP